MNVVGVTSTADGHTLQFGEPEKHNSNGADLDAELAEFEARHHGHG